MLAFLQAIREGPQKRWRQLLEASVTFHVDDRPEGLLRAARCGCEENDQNAMLRDFRQRVRRG